MQKYLARDLRFGESQVRLVDPVFRWRLDLKADSAIYLSPNLDARTGRTLVSVNLFRSLIKFAPSVTLQTDTLALVLKPVADTAAAKPKSDSAIAFPDIKLPAAVVVDAGRITIADSAGPLLRGDGVHLETRGKRGIALTIREVEARQAAGLNQSLEVSADWSDSARVKADLAWRHAQDSLTLKAGLSKRDIRRGSVALRARMASSAPYARALKLAPSMPRAESLYADIEVSLDNTLRAKGSVDGRFEGFSDSAAYRLETLRMALRLEFRDSAGTWSLAGKGTQGESIDLDGRLFLTAADSLGNPAWIARHAGVTVGGPVRGIKVLAGDEIVRADMRIAELRASREALKLDLRTGDGSFLRADLRHDPSAPGPRDSAFALPPWQGPFSADIKPGERWIHAFADTNVAFRKFALSGRMRGGVATARMEAAGLKAYGLLADSLRLDHRLDARAYTLETSHLYHGKTDWVLTGSAGMADPDHPLRFRLAHPAHGSAEVRMPEAGRMEASLKNLAIDPLPYQGLASLKPGEPRVTAEFRWDKPAKRGQADVRLQGKQKGERLDAEIHAAWTPAWLEVKEIKAAMSGSDLRAQARIRLRGREFYALGGLESKDVEAAELSSNQFDLAKAMRVAMPEPPLKSGLAAGKLAYAPATGFTGTYRIKDLHPSGEDAKIAVKDLGITGKGDSLIVRAVTVSAEPLFNDTITLAVGGLLGRSQGITLNARVGPGLRVALQGTMAEFKDLKASLRVDGYAALPEGSGELRNLDVRAAIAIPLRDGVKGLSVTADTLKGVYHVAGLDTQSFSAPVAMRGGKVSIPDFRLRGADGAEMKGSFAFDPAAKRFTGNLEGNSFAAKFGEGDKVKLRDVKIDIRSDSTSLTVNAAIGSGSAEHIKAPMRVAGDFSRVGVLYRAPKGKLAQISPARGGAVPYLRVKATLDSSEMRYRLRSMETLQNLFKRSPEKRAVKREKPMQVDIDVVTDGSGNSVETDIVRMAYVGNFSMSGLYPYALVKGRISSSQGELGPKKQSYAIRRMDLKWLNTPLEEGKLDMEAKKRLARNCEAGTIDSCDITTRLTGELSDLQFTYDSDCQSAYGGQVEVAALIYSVRRGCYSTAFSAGGSGLSRQEQALGLLEPFASKYLSDAVGRLSGNWIASAQVSGLGALATDKEKAGAGADSGSAAQEAIALEILSKEFWRTRLRLKSAYAPENAEVSTPWNYRAALEWRPPVPPFIESERWRNRVRNNVNVEAAVYTNPDRTKDETRDEGLLKRLGLNYVYGFWGSLWAKKGTIPRPGADTTGGSGKKVALPETQE